MGEKLHWWQTRWFVAAMAIAVTIPLWWPEIPPLVDLPGHMARYRVQLAIGGNPWLNQWYDFRWSLIGNLGIDLLIIPLAPILGLELTVKLIVMAIPALTVTGLLWISREVHGRIPATALFALPLAYSYPFQFGFVNFALSMALALNMFAWWLRLARLGRLQLRAVLFLPLSCALWVCHTFGWGVLGVLAFSAELIRQHDLRKDGRGGHWLEALVRAGLGCLPLALPMALMIFWRSGDHVTGQTADWFNWQAKFSWVTMVLRDRWQVWDVASATVLFLILVKGMRDRRIEHSRNLALSAIFLLVVFLILPRIVFGSAYADMRLAPFALAIAVIGLRPRGGLSFRGAATFATLGLIFFGARLVGTTWSYWLYDRSYDRALTALQYIPDRARVVSFVGRRCRDDWAYSRLEHVPGLLLERKFAYTNDQWSMAGAQQLTTRYYAAKGFAHDPSQVVTDRRCRGEWWRPLSMALATFPRDAFDYVWLLNPPRYDPALVRGLTPIWRDGRNILFRIDDRRPPADIPPALVQPQPRLNGAISAR
ncbi:hypothetical protein [Sphingomonas mollis]|uniref:Glycosyltransferase RgtA/B/C/D-like domain-containing protein n=1 Tax=Sphingomonas mollis TaxID=2795726 RepID=A0ABS0XR82_9SPHN|nr:hypothetical protein [Sphingomonas sp. BT553]MBJ6122548.1 hypothetical protein [Sphingomonas sp. BT553]